MGIANRQRNTKARPSDWITPPPLNHRTGRCFIDAQRSTKSPQSDCLTNSTGSEEQRSSVLTHTKQNSNLNYINTVSHLIMCKSTNVHFIIIIIHYSQRWTSLYKIITSILPFITFRVPKFHAAVLPCNDEWTISARSRR